MLDFFDSIPVAFATAAPEQVTLTADDDNVPPEFTQIVKDSGLSIVTCAEIAKTIGMTREKWRAALESELKKAHGAHGGAGGGGLGVAPPDGGGKSSSLCILC